MSGEKKKEKERDVLVAIVNNHIDTVTGISNYLEGKGFRTIWAYDGKDAVRLCEEKKPDLLFIDIQMPEMNGFDVARALPNQKILFMAAPDDVERHAAAFKNSIGVLHKPVNYGELIEVLRREFKLKKPEFEV